MEYVMTEEWRKKLAANMKNAENNVDFCEALYRYIIERLELPKDTHQRELYYLVLFSVRLKMPNEDVSTLESRLATVDCHQTSYIVSKKTLLMMEIERELGVSLDAISATDVVSVDDYADKLWEKTNEK